MHTCIHNLYTHTEVHIHKHKYVHTCITTILFQMMKWRRQKLSRSKQFKKAMGNKQLIFVGSIHLYSQKFSLILLIQKNGTDIHPFSIHASKL